MPVISNAGDQPVITSNRVKPIWALVNALTLETHGDAFTSKAEAKKHAAKLNAFIKRDSRCSAPSTRERYIVASVHPELAQGLTINPYIE